ncbi:MAG: PepSY domain-containing protein [Pseudomonadales bacterium]|nr:PepSY domain-containing protein [Pseudomonadales bacterium]
MRFWVFLLIVMASPLVSASPFAQGKPLGVIAARDFMHPEPKGMLPNAPNARPPKVGSQEAASSVRHAYANSKILSVQLIEAKGPPVYRVKTLSEDGVVKYVFVDATSGDIFE